MEGEWKCLINIVVVGVKKERLLTLIGKETFLNYIYSIICVEIKGSDAKLHQRDEISLIS